MSERPRFYLDAHIDRVVLEALHAHGIDVEAAYDVGLRTAPDEEHLRYATLHGRVIVTRDHDFLAMHGLGIPHAGIIRVRRRGPGTRD